MILSNRKARNTYSAGASNVRTRQLVRNVHVHLHGIDGDTSVNGIFVILENNLNGKDIHEACN